MTDVPVFKSEQCPALAQSVLKAIYLLAIACPPPPPPKGGGGGWARGNFWQRSEEWESNLSDQQERQILAC